MSSHFSSDSFFKHFLPDISHLKNFPQTFPPDITLGQFPDSLRPDQPSVTAAKLLVLFHFFIVRYFFYNSDVLC